MKRLLILMLLSLPLCVDAQQIHAFVTSGVSVSQIEGDELKGFRHYGYTGGVGALTSISRNNRWGLSVETLFSQHGSYDNSGNPYSLKLTTAYVEIPLLLHYQDPYGGMLLGAGLVYGRLVQQPHGKVLFNPEGLVPDTADMTFLPNDISVALDARFSIWKGLQFNIRWQYSIIPIKRDWLFRQADGYETLPNGEQRTRWITESNDCYNNVISVRLIYQF